MRVSFYGNYCNFQYELAKALREGGEFDVHLYIDSSADVQQRPESDEPELAGKYPEWIHTGRYNTFRHRIAPWTSPLVKELANSDVAMVSGVGPMFAQFSGVPYAFHTAGGDSTLLPFYWRSWVFNRAFAPRVEMIYTAYWQRRGMRRAAEVWTHPFAQFQTSVRKIVPGDRVSPVYYPAVLDTTKFSREGRPREKTSAVREIKTRFDFVVFHPSRIMLRDSAVYRETGQWKRNDLLLEAFAAFSAQDTVHKAGLIMIDREGSFEVEKAKKLIAALGIENRVVWLRPPRADGFTRDEMIDFYAASDVVADQFGAGFFGYAVLEALALELPVLSVVDPAVMAAHYPWHPILSDTTVSGNAALLSGLYRDNAYRLERGSAGRRWVEQFHSFEMARRVYGDGLRSLFLRSRRRTVQNRKLKETA